MSISSFFKKSHILYLFIIGISFFSGLVVCELKYKFNKNFTVRTDEFENTILVDNKKILSVVANTDYVNVYYKKSYLTFGLNENGFYNLSLHNNIKNQKFFSGFDAEGDGSWNFIKD